jgi:hypothetical protein
VNKEISDFIQRQKEAKRKGESKLRMMRLVEGIRRDVAIEDYMDTKEFCEKQIEWRKKIGNPIEPVKKIMDDLKSYYTKED